MKMTLQEIRIIATGPCIANQLRDVNTICRRSWYIAAHVWKIYDFNIEVVPFIINLVLIWPLSSSSRYKSKNDADEAVSVVSLTSSSGGYINGRNSANLELLIDKTSSIYLYVKLKALDRRFVPVYCSDCMLVCLFVCFVFVPRVHTCEIICSWRGHSLRNILRLL